jgi:hypothetical protein
MKTKIKPTLRNILTGSMFEVIVFLGFFYAAMLFTELWYMLGTYLNIENCPNITPDNAFFSAWIFYIIGFFK